MWTRTSEPVGIALATLRENPLRTLLSTLGVIIGVAALVSVLVIGDGMERLGRQEVERTTGVQSVVLTPQLSDEVNGEPVTRKDYPVFGPSDAAEAARFSGAASVNLQLTDSAIVSGPGGRRRSAAINATLATNLEFSNLEFAAGRYFSEIEASQRSPVAVVSHRLGEEIVPPGHTVETLVGQRILINGEPFRVVGLLASYPGERRRLVYVPIQTAKLVMPSSTARRAPVLYLKAGTIEDVATVEALSGDWLAQRFGRWEPRVKVETSAARLAQVSRGVTTFKLFLGALTGISLVVGGIGIMNVLLASIAERTREIGVRIAIGARRRDIVAQFLAESVAITGAGSAIGIALGIAAAWIFTAIMKANTEARIDAVLSLSSVGIAVAAAVIVGLSCGLYPALRASRLSPIDAIRND